MNLKFVKLFHIHLALTKIIHMLELCSQVHNIITLQGNVPEKYRHQQKDIQKLNTDGQGNIKRIKANKTIQKVFQKNKPFLIHM